MPLFWSEIKKLAYSILIREIRDWEYVDTNFFKKPEWTINISNVFRFQDNLYGKEISEFKSALMDELVLLVIEQNFKIIHENENELVLGK
jgi:hypothetical protein